MELLEGELEKIEAEVAAILQRQACERNNLLPILQEVQEKLGYLPKEAMQAVAKAMDIPEVDVYGVGTFYNQFRMTPPGKNQIKVCMGTACHLTGGQIIMDSFERRLEIGEGDTTPDREFSLERVACVGCCALAPVVVVNDKVEAKVRPTRVDGILLGLGLDQKNGRMHDPGLSEGVKEAAAGRQEEGRKQ